MMMSEFIERTGFEPTCEEYAEIEEAYYEFHGNKDEFCKQFVEHDGEKKVCDARVQRIAQLKSKIVEVEKGFIRDIQQKEQEIARLTAALDREQEWKPYKCEWNVKQEDYERLEKDCCTEDMADSKAVELIASEFGFVPERIIQRYAGTCIEDKEYLAKLFDSFLVAAYLYDDHFRIIFNYTGECNSIDKPFDSETVLAADSTTAECSYKLSLCPPRETLKP